MSKGSDKLYRLLKEYFPGKTVVKEYAFVNGLRLDFYLPELNAAFEWDGPQHQHYLSYFHSSKSEFYLAQNRDEQKEYICQQLGINLFRFKEGEDLDINILANIYENLGPGDGVVRPGALKWLSKKVQTSQSQTTARKKAYESYKNSEAYQTKKEKAREFRRKKYKELKSKS